MTKDTTKCPSRLALEKFAQGELTDPNARHGLESHITDCQRCTNWLAANAATDKLASEALDSEAFARLVVDRHNSRSRRPTESATSLNVRFWHWLKAHQVAGLAAAACSLLLVFAVSKFVTTNTSTAVPFGEQVAMKGTSTFKIYCQRKGNVFELKPEQAVIDGDRLRFEAFSDDYGYALLLSIQDDGEVSIYVPFRGRGSISFSRGKASFLQEESIELDNSSHDELLVLLLTSRPMSADHARKLARQAFEDSGKQLDAITGLEHSGESLTRLLRRMRRP